MLERSFMTTISPGAPHCARTVFWHSCSPAVSFTPYAPQTLSATLSSCCSLAGNLLSLIVGESIHFPTFESLSFPASVLTLSVTEVVTLWEEVYLLLTEANQCTFHLFPSFQGVCSLSCIFIITFSPEFFFSASNMLCYYLVLKKKIS